MTKDGVIPRGWHTVGAGPPDAAVPVGGGVVVGAAAPVPDTALVVVAEPDAGDGVGVRLQADAALVRPLP